MTHLLNVTAECFYGYPFVVGECNNLEEAQRIIEIAQRITEKQPIPFLMKKGGDDDCNPALNLKISTEVKARLLADKKIFATNVVVKSIQCQAVLLGVLGSKEAILAAIEHSEKVEGVKKVHSFLVSTDTGRSWDSVFKAMGKDASDSTGDAITVSDDKSPVKKEPTDSNEIESNNTNTAQSLEPNPPASSLDNGNDTIQPESLE
jgi:hyperosmotically inducible protein